MKSRNVKLFTVSLCACLLVLTGCASVGGSDSGAAQSADVGADVLTERNILKAISDDPGLNASNIGVSCIDGVVTLRGSVDSQIERTLAEKIATSVSGVSGVNNLITFQ